MGGIAAGFRRRGPLIVAALAVAVLAAVHQKYRWDHKHDVAQAYEDGVARGLEYVRASLDPVAQEPFFIFDETVVPWSRLVPNLAGAYGADKGPAKQWTAPAVCGTFPVNGEPPPAGEVRSEGEDLCFGQPGEYYLRTTVGDFKLLILDRRAKRDDHAMAIAAFVARNIVPSMADARKIQPNYSYFDYHRPDKALRKFFATDQPLGFQCGYAAEFLNFVLSRGGFQVRRVWLRTEKEGAHFISQVFLPGRGKWAAVDPMYGAAVADRQGELLSVEEIAKLVRQRPDDLFVRDIAGKRWLKSPFGNFMHEFTWTPALLDEPCVDPPKYRAMIRDCTVEYWCIDYDRLFGWGSVSKFSWDGRNLVR